MSDAATALALLNLAGAAQSAQAGGLSSAKSTAPQGNQGFASFLLAAAGLNTKAAAATKLVQDTGTQLTEAKEAAKADAQAILAPTLPQQASADAAANQGEVVPLLPAETKEAFVAAVKAKSGKADPAEDAGVAAPAADPTQTNALGLPVPATPQPSPDTVPVAQSNASPATVGDATGAPKPAPALPITLPLPNGTAPENIPTGNAPNTTAATDSGTPKPDANATGAATATDAAADALAASAVPPLPKDPGETLDAARRATSEIAASSHAANTQSAVLEAVRDIGSPQTNAGPSTAGADTKPAIQPPIHPAAQQPPKPETPAAHTKADAQPPVAQANSAAGPSSAASTAPDNHAAARDDAPTTIANTASAQPDPTTTPRPDAQTPVPQSMTVIKATQTNNGVPVLPTEQIAITVAHNIKQGNNRFEIRLDPPELGRIDVRLDLSHNGRANATLTVDRPETLQMLTRDAKVLQQTLSDAGLRTDTGSLSFTLRDQSNQQQMQMGQGGNSGRQAQDDDAENAAKAAAQAQTTVILSASVEPGRLDLRV